MEKHRLHGNPPVDVTLRRSGRARRISLRISQLDGRVTLTVPSGVRTAAALDFARDKADWIRDRLAARPGDVAVGIGTVLPVEGIARRVIAAPGRRIELGAAEIAVPADAAGARLHRYLRELARDRLAAASDAYAGRLGRAYRRIAIRDTRSRWGSCSSRGGLSYSWRLVLAPPEVLQYVAAHEVAHLREMNHSAAFWNVVAGLYGPYEAPRRWLGEQGAHLHRYRFAA